MVDIENNNIENTTDNQDNNDIHEPSDNSENNIISEKLLKTDLYTLNAIKRYRAKNAEKVKEYNKQYHQKKKAEKHQENPYIKFTKAQLYDKIIELEAKIKTLECVE